MTEWFDERQVVTESRKVIPVRIHWLCPKEGCDGRMINTGTMWPTRDPGYHHKCDKCGQYLAIHGETYPKVIYVEE